MKPQTVRLADVFLIGPLMIWGGLKLSDEYPLLGGTLATAGVGTILYNGKNLLRVQREGVIPGGYAAGKLPSPFDPAQLAAGTKVEMEHTTDRDIAREIAMDHLAEDPRYYDKLRAAGL